MLKHITGTFFTRISVAVVNFSIIILTARLMGAEVRGSISLCMLAIAIAGLINEIVGGPAVVYLVPRFNNRSLALISYAWAVFTSIACSVLLAFFNFYDSAFLAVVCACSSMLCAGSIHQFLLLGHQKIKAFNSIALTQSMVLFIVFLCFIFANAYTIQSYFYALFAGYTIAFLLGIKHTFFIWENKAEQIQQPGLSLLVKNGFLTQLASLTYLMSSRITYYFSTHFLTLAFVGVLSTAVSITDAAMLFSSSVALITASTVANETDKNKAATTTVILIKLSFLISLAILIALCIFPESLMSGIFGKDFSGIKLLIFTLIPGALANSVSQIISHYYSGMGKFSINTKVGFISLAVSVLAGLCFFQTNSILLPGCIISASSVVAMIYFVVLFLKDHQLKLQAIIPSKRDVKLFFNQVETKN